MPIVGMNFRSITAKYDPEKVQGNLEIGSTPKIENIEKKDIHFAGMTEALVITFSFKTTYSPDAAEIAFTGEIIYQTEDYKKIEKTWKEKKLLDDSVGVEILNAIFRKCLTKAITLAEDLRLPPPIVLPVVTKKQAESKSDGDHSHKKDGK
jgi:hypothetical protein